MGYERTVRYYEGFRAYLEHIASRDLQSSLLDSDTAGDDQLCSTVPEKNMGSPECRGWRSLDSYRQGCQDIQSLTGSHSPLEQLKESATLASVVHDPSSVSSHTYFLAEFISLSFVASFARTSHGSSWQRIINLTVRFWDTRSYLQAGVSAVSRKAGKFAGAVGILFTAGIWRRWY